MKWLRRNWEIGLALAVDAVVLAVIMLDAPLWIAAAALGIGAAAFIAIWRRALR